MIYREYGLWTGYGLGVLVFRLKRWRKMEVIAFERDWQ